MKNAFFSPLTVKWNVFCASKNHTLRGKKVKSFTLFFKEYLRNRRMTIDCQLINMLKSTNIINTFKQKGSSRNDERGHATMCMHTCLGLLQNPCMPHAANSHSTWMDQVTAWPGKADLPAGTRSHTGATFVTRGTPKTWCWYIQAVNLQLLVRLSESSEPMSVIKNCGVK